MTENESGIITSVGSLGVDIMSSNHRVRCTYQYEPISELHELVEMFEAVDGTTQHEQRSRAVFRSVVEQHVLLQAAEEDDPILGNIEVAFPLEGLRSSDLWLVGLARNNADRISYHPIEQIILDTESSRQRGRPDTVLELFGRISDDSSLQTTILDNQIDDLHALWGRTFGWTREGVVALQQTLREEAELDPKSRQTWFSGISNRMTGRMVGASTAELLQLRERSGNMVDLIESTEWGVDENCRGQGINAASIAFLNAQIYSDLDASDTRAPTIFAECNFGSRSDLSAHKAGFSIPDRAIFGRQVSQANIQNVVVNDGILPEDVYRDFTLNVVRNLDRLRMYPIEPLQDFVYSTRRLEMAA